MYRAEPLCPSSARKFLGKFIKVNQSVIWLRSIGSSTVGEAILVIISMPILFLGKVSHENLGSMWIRVGDFHHFLGKKAVSIFNSRYSSSRYPYACL